MFRKRGQYSEGIRWLKRLLSSSHQQQLPAAVLQLLKQTPVAVQQFPNQGRGLVAATELHQGQVVLVEQPFVCCPAICNRKKVCYQCLKVLPPPDEGVATSSLPSTIHAKGHAFCSAHCFAIASQAYHSLESQLNLSQLDAYCETHSERFPLLAARLALTAAQAAMNAAPATAAADEDEALEPDGAAADIARLSRRSSSSKGLGTVSWLSRGSKQSSHGAARPISSSLSTTSSISLSAAQASGDTSGDALRALDDINTSLSMLCFANVPPPPPAPWQQSYLLLVGAVEAAVGCHENIQQDAGLSRALQQLDITWYTAVLSRLHLNTFKVDAIMGIDWTLGHAAAAAMLGQGSSSGSALYLLASMFNHSCEPNMHVSFPHNDSTAVFTAARDIAAGEQLFISYLDTDQEVSTRQDYLAFAYGFRCRCPRCQEELESAARAAPPQL